MNLSYFIILWLLLCQQGNHCGSDDCKCESRFTSPSSPCGCGRGDRELHQEEPFIPGGRNFGPFGGQNTCGCEEKPVT